MLDEHTIKQVRSLLKRKISKAKCRDNPQEVSVDIDYLMKIGNKQKWKCALSGVDLQFIPGKGKKNPFVVTIDRIDSNKGYVKGNIQLLAWQVNRAKGDYSTKEFMKMCTQVARRGMK